MALNNIKHIENLLDRYFEGLTTLEEEKQLQHYFLSEDVAPHLAQYRPLFHYFASEKKQELAPELPKTNLKRPIYTWVAVAAVFVLFAGLIFTWNQPINSSQDLGTFDDPELAMAETLKALEMVSRKVNKGKESVMHLQEFNQSKQFIFKTQQP